MTTKEKKQVNKVNNVSNKPRVKAGITDLGTYRGKPSGGKDCLYMDSPLRTSPDDFKELIRQLRFIGYLYEKGACINGKRHSIVMSAKNTSVEEFQSVVNGFTWDAEKPTKAAKTPKKGMTIKESATNVTANAIKEVMSALKAELITKDEAFTLLQKIQH